MKKVLFVCTGNTCRSPMAELYFTAFCRKAEHPEITAVSAGIFASNGSGISHAAAGVMQEFAIDTSAFRTTRFSPAVAAECDLLIGMTRAHAALMRSLVPECADKVRTLIPGEDVPDPFGGTVADYKQVFSVMRPALEKLAQELILQP